MRLMRLMMVVPDADFRLCDLTHARSRELRGIVSKLTAHQCVALISRTQDQVMFLYAAHVVNDEKRGPRMVLTSSRARVTDHTRFNWRMWQQYAEDAGIMLEGFKTFKAALG